MTVDNPRARLAAELKPELVFSTRRGTDPALFFKADQTITVRLHIFLPQGPRFRLRWKSPMPYPGTLKAVRLGGKQMPIEAYNVKREKNHIEIWPRD